MKVLISGIMGLFFIGCVNKQGVSLEYNNECHIKYDLYGTYQKICPYNIYNFKKTHKKDCLECN